MPIRELVSVSTTRKCKKDLPLLISVLDKGYGRWPCRGRNKLKLEASKKIRTLSNAFSIIPKSKFTIVQKIELKQKTATFSKFHPHCLYLVSSVAGVGAYPTMRSRVSEGCCGRVLKELQRRH